MAKDVNSNDVVEEVAAEDKKSAGDKVSEGMSVAGEKVAEGMNVAGQKMSEGISTASKTLSEAIKQVEGFGKELGKALQDRANVVMVRVNDDSLSYLDMLVEADVTKSRSESAAFLINEGIKVNGSLFNKIREITDQIAALKAQLRDSVATKE